MHEVVLLQRIYGRVSLEGFEEYLKGLCEGVRVTLSNFSRIETGWVKLSVSGEDEIVTLRFLEQKVGLAPIVAECIERFSVLRGRITLPNRSKMGISVDVGVVSPKPTYAIVPLQRLQGQLVDGRKFALKRIAELFGLVENFPMEIRIREIGSEGFVAELTEKQLELYSHWIDSRVDRLIVLGTFAENVKRAVHKARLSRDVLGVESLSPSEHVVVCKLGTDGVGLAPKLGRRLPQTVFAFFSPRRVLELVGERW